MIGGNTKPEIKIEETMGSFSNYKANFSYDLPDTNNFLKIIFQGTDHILVKIELRVSLAMCLHRANNVNIHTDDDEPAISKQIDKFTYHDETKSQ